MDFELIHLKGNTYYIKSSTNFGVYKLNDTDVCLIDGGLDEFAGVNVERILTENGWTLKLIIVTHTHADHTGALRYLQEKYQAPILVKNFAVGILSEPMLNSMLVVGGFPTKDLRNKFFYSDSCKSQDIDGYKLPDGLIYVYIPGHGMDSIAVKTDDGVWFLSDNIISEETIYGFGYPYLISVGDFLRSLDVINEMEGDIFVPGHSAPVSDIKPLVKINKERIYQIINDFMSFLKEPQSVEDILQKGYVSCGHRLTFSKSIMLYSIIRTYLGYLFDEGKIIHKIIDNKLVWQVKEE